MDYFMQFHWWYVVVGLLVFLLIFGESKGGRVVKRFTATMNVLDPSFDGCCPDVSYSIFKEGSPDHINIEIEGLPLSAGEEVKFLINGKALATVTVKRNREAEFDHWSDEGVPFPVIKAGDTLVMKYLGTEVLEGVFK